MKNQWYESNTGNHQGLVIEEGTGKNIAVTYEKETAAFIVTACNRHDELVEMLQILVDHASEKYPHFESERGQMELANARTLIQQARGVA